MFYNKNYLYYKALAGRFEDFDIKRKISKILRGYEGEKILDQHLKQHDDIIYAHNLEFIIDKMLQIDFIIIKNYEIIILEAKHYYGDFIFHSTHMESPSNNQYPLPFNQLHAAIQNIKRLCMKLNIEATIYGYTVFTSDTFTPLNSIPHRSQVLLKSEFHKFHDMFASNQISRDQQLLNEVMQHQEIFTDQFEKLSVSDLSKIKKGLKCPKCENLHTIKIIKNKKFFKCLNCGVVIKRQELYYYNILELARIKRGEGFTIDEAREWCESQNNFTIRKLCNINFSSKGIRFKKYFLNDKKSDFLPYNMSPLRKESNCD